jgi:hypothetical protein
MSDDIQPVSNEPAIDEAKEGELIPAKTAESALVEELSKGKDRKYKRFVMAALGSIPWIGSYLSILGAVAGLSAEFDQEKVNELLKLWIQENQPKLDELKNTLNEMQARLDSLGEETQQRIESPEYLSLVRNGFRVWDQAETAEKREYIKRLLTNAGATKLVPDDLVRLFISWINNYHESHFAVIKQIYKKPGITRAEIWDEVHTERHPENSSEADLYRYLIRDLSIGGVIRQEKEVNEYGEFVKKRPIRTPRGQGSQTMESAYEETKPYVLTKLGMEFIHYVLDDVVQRVQGQN